MVQNSIKVNFSAQWDFAVLSNGICRFGKQVWLEIILVREKNIGYAGNLFPRFTLHN